jgi:hypothetical protein
VRLLLAVASASVLVAAPARAAVPGAARASVTPATAGSTATLRMSLRTELQCGALRPGRVALRLPAAMTIPASPLVRVAQERVDGVTVSGHTLVIAVPRPPGPTCMVIAPGRVTFTVAGVRNPAAGSYTVAVTVGGRTFTAKLAVRP